MRAPRAAMTGLRTSPASTPSPSAASRAGFSVEALNQPDRFRPWAGLQDPPDERAVSARKRPSAEGDFRKPRRGEQTNVEEQRFLGRSLSAGNGAPWDLTP